MKRNTALLNRIRYALKDPHYPNVGLEIDTDCIRLAVIQVEKGKIVVQHLDWETLPPGSVEITPYKPNIHALEPVAEALKQLWSRNRTRLPKICLLLQDRCAVSFNLVLEHPPSSPEECDELIRFKLKKFVPFRIEDARITFFDPSGGHSYRQTNLWVTVLNQAVLQQYEQFVESTVNAECGLVDLCTFNMMNFAHHETMMSGLQGKDLLFVNLNQTYISVAIIQKSRLVFYRSRDLERQNGVMEEALSEIHPITLFYMDKLGGEKLERAYVYAFEESEELIKKMESELFLDARPLSIEPFSGARFDPTNRVYRESFVPLVGLLVSRRVEFS